MQGRARILDRAGDAALAAIPAAAAQASIPLNGAKGEPLDTTEANANTRFHIHLDLGGSEHIKDLTQTLPFGMAPRPHAAHLPCGELRARRRLPGEHPDRHDHGALRPSGPRCPIPLTQQTITGRIYFLSPDAR